jgi:catabolite repression protein CreC
VKQLEGELLSAAAFLPRYLITANKIGLVRLWIRPLPPVSTRMKNGAGGGLPRSAVSMADPEDVG